MAGQVDFKAGNCILEGIYAKTSLERGVAITHPHPLYGGDMFNPVVEAIEKAYRQADFATLRFNFRGTGHSSGSFDTGIGERDDVAAAVDFLRRDGLCEIHLAGYSFGAWVNAMALQDDLSVDGLTMVAPPVAFIAFEANIHLPMLSMVVAGERDEFAPPDLLRPAMQRWNPDASLDIIDGADHFFFGHLDEVTRRLLHQFRQRG